MSVCLSNRLGLAALASPVGDEALCAGMLGDWPGRQGSRDPVELHPTRCSFKPSLTAGVPTSFTDESMDQSESSVVLGIQAPVPKLSLFRRPALLGLFPGVPNQSSPYTFWDREQGTERTNTQ